MRDYDLFLMDLDGTLLMPGHTLPKENIEAVQALTEIGVPVVLASGRIEHSMRCFYDELGLRTPLVSCNGALAREADGTVLHHYSVPTEYADELLDFVVKNDLHMNYYREDELSCWKESRWGDFYSNHVGVPIKPYAPEDLAGSSPTKLVIVDDPAKIKVLLQEFEARFGGVLYVTTSEPQYLEFMHPEASKARGLETVCRFFDVPIERTVAIGDAPNDVPMLQAAGLGLAMANAKPEVQAAADRIVGRNDEFGVARVVEELFFSDRPRRLAPLG